MTNLSFNDEEHINVPAQEFKKTCLELHKQLNTPVAMLFACDERRENGCFGLRCVFISQKQKKWLVVYTQARAESAFFDCLSKDIHSAILFEREIKEMFGIEASGAPDERRLRLHDEAWPGGNYPLRKDFQKMQAGDLSDYEFGRVEGEGIFEVPVGPVHAGIIGPGHFRFSVAGEPIVNLEMRLGFSHRGAEKCFEGKDISAVALSESVAGDTAFAHGFAFCHALEKIYSLDVPQRACYLRVLFLELERMYNHISGIGGIAVDVGFSFPAAQAAIIKEELQRLNQRLTGSRFLKGVNTAGGVLKDIDAQANKLVEEALDKIMQDFYDLRAILNNSVSFMDRVDGTGVLKKKTAEDIGVTGLPARACGIHQDLRRDFFVIYEKLKFKMAQEQAGDVLARLRVRFFEFEESARLIREVLKHMPGGEICCLKPIQPKKGNALGYAEGWRGPVIYWVSTTEQGVIDRCKIVDASFQNWQGLAYCVLGDIIPDFPVCNKSFDLSYPGGDL